MESLFVEEVAILEDVVLTGKEKRKMFQEQALTRVGETRINNLGSLMIVDTYNNSQDILVRFKEGNLVKTTWQQFCNGSVKNVYDKSKFGIGYLGEGKYEPFVDGTMTDQYRTWSSMLARCYSSNHHIKHPTYKGCIVTEDWHCFQNFAKWYDENYYEINGITRMELDKDILIKGNRIYSPETCVFVPKFINTLLVKGNSRRGNLPVGVRIDKSSKKNPYMARSGNGRGEQVFLGNHNTPEKAFLAYKAYKEQLLKDIAKEFKGRIPDKLFFAMQNYVVEITD